MVHFSFSEVPAGFDAGDVNVSGGTLSGLAATGDGSSYSAGFTPAGDGSGAFSLAVAAGAYTDLAGNPGAAATLTGSVVDTVAPVLDPAGSLPASGATSVPTGSRIVIGFSEALVASSDLSSVRLRDTTHGVDLAAGVHIDGAGRLLIEPAAPLPAGAHLEVLWGPAALKDAAGNGAAALSGGYGFDTAGVLAPNPPGGSTVVDGVPVQTTLLPQPDGSTERQLVVPPVTSTRLEDHGTPNPSLADIPVAVDPGGQPLVTVSMPDGLGLHALDFEGGAMTLRDRLIAAASPLVATGSAYDLILASGIDQFMTTVGAESEVSLRTIGFDAAAGAGQGGPLGVMIHGASGTGEHDALHPNRQEALVIDARGLPQGSVLQLDDVEFAIVVGPARLVGGDGANRVIGDSAAQFIVLGADDDVLHGGGGDDTVGSKAGNDQLFGDDGNDWLVGGTGDDVLDGGAGNDVLQGGQSDAGRWTFQLDAGGHLVSHYVARDAALANQAGVTVLGAWSAPGQPRDSDDRLAYSYQDPERLQTVAMLSHMALDRLPTLQELNIFSDNKLSESQLGDAALVAYVAAHPQLAGAALETQVRSLVESAWGPGAASDALVPVGVAAITQGLSWSQAILYLAHSSPMLQRFSDAAGALPLTQPYDSAELGWLADSGNDVLRGGPGDDRLVGGGGSDLLDGGPGYDTAVFTGNVADYVLKRVGTNGELAILDRFSGDVDTLIGIERLEIGSHSYTWSAQALAGAGLVPGLPLSDLLVELTGQPLALGG